MVKRVILMIVLVFSFAGVSSGDEFSSSLPCESGGEIWYTLTYNAVGGVYSIGFTFNSCVMENKTINGTIYSSGTFLFTSQSTATVDINTTSNATVTENELSRSFNCNGKYNGTYDLSTEMLNGNMSLNCTGSGSYRLDIFSLLFGPIPNID